MNYAELESLLRDLDRICVEMTARDPRLTGLAEDVRGEMKQISYDIEGAPDRPLSNADAHLLATAITGLRQLVLELDVANIPPGRNGVGVDHSVNILRPYRPHIRTIQEVLRAG